jgi:hypothetical protein
MQCGLHVKSLQRLCFLSYRNRSVTTLKNNTILTTSEKIELGRLLEWDGADNGRLVFMAL